MSDQYFPWNWENIDFLSSCIPKWFNHQFDGGSIVRIVDSDGSKHLWLIYISQEHCHFFKNGAHVTFKAGPGLILKKWGLRKLIHEEMP